MEDSSLSLFDQGKSLIERDWTVEFHGVIYLVNITVSASLLTLDVEVADTNDRWSSEFSSHYIEEITQKAGSFKKFDVFVKMLMSAFTKGSESVFVDLLTYSDLEMLKARKLGTLGASSASLSGTSVSSQGNSLNRSHLKRYLILTYKGEFDRVHFPLPLAFEEVPNSDALKRTIRRLRKELEERKLADLEPSNDKELGLRHALTQTRLENTELRHRLRQSESRSMKQSISSPNSLNTSSSLVGPMTSSIQELAATNAKYKRIIEALRKDLALATDTYERLRVESGKEIARWKSRYGGFTGTNGGIEGINIGGAAESASIVKTLKRRIIDLEQDLAIERRFRSGGTRTSDHNQNYRSNRDNSNSYTGSSSNNQRPSSSCSVDRYMYRHTQASAAHTIYQNGTSSTSRPSSLGPRQSSSVNKSSIGRSSTPSTSRSRHRDPSPQLQSNLNSQKRTSSLSPSSGQRFDPTAYHQLKRDKAVQLERERGWNNRTVAPASSPSSTTAGRHRYTRSERRESGYTSANSQSSSGSRQSRSSKSSNGSNRSTSRDANTSTGRSRDKRGQASTQRHSEAVIKSGSTSKSDGRERRTFQRGIAGHGSDSDDDQFKRHVTAAKTSTGFSHGHKQTSTASYSQSSIGTGSSALKGKSSVVGMTSATKTGDIITLANKQSMGNKASRVPTTRTEQTFNTIAPVIIAESASPSMSRCIDIDEHSLDLDQLDLYSNRDESHKLQYENSLRTLSKSMEISKPISNNQQGKSASVGSPRKSAEGVAGVASSIEASIGSLHGVVQKQSSSKTSVTNTVPGKEKENGNENKDDDISEIDRWIQALQSYLDKARSGIISQVDSNS